jgi:hypothetical protein
MRELCDDRRIGAHQLLRDFAADSPGCGAMKLDSKVAVLVREREPNCDSR